MAGFNEVPRPPGRLGEGSTLPSDDLEAMANTWADVASQLRDDQKSLAGIADVAADCEPMVADAARNMHNALTNMLAVLQCNAVHLSDQIGAHAKAQRLQEGR